MSNYNGWTNEATWAVNQTVTSNQNLWGYYGALVLSIANRSKSRAEMIRQLAAKLKNSFSVYAEPRPDKTGHEGVKASLMQAALNVVNWEEIAEQWVNSLVKEPQNAGN